MRLRHAMLILAVIVMAGCGGEPDEPTEGDRTRKTPIRKKGEGYGPGPVSTPIAAYFSAKERIALMPIVQAMQLYRAANGRFPESHEEFMKEIINKKRARIKLPELPEGVEDVYDAETAAQMNHCDLDNMPLTVQRSPSQKARRSDACWSSGKPITQSGSTLFRAPFGIDPNHRAALALL